MQINKIIKICKMLIIHFINERSLLMRKTILLILAAFLIAAGPKVTKHKTVAPSKEIWPTRPGNVWIYKTTIFDDKGVVNEERFDTLTVLNDVLVGTDLFYKVKTVESKDNFTYNEYFINKEDGFYSYGENKDKNRYITYFKYPCAAGDTFKLSSDLMKVDSIDCKISTPAGNFKCFKYSIFYKSTQVLNAFYFSPGDGMVYYESHKKNKLNFKRELISFNLK